MNRALLKHRNVWCARGQWILANDETKPTGADQNTLSIQLPSKRVTHPLNGLRVIPFCRGHDTDFSIHDLLSSILHFGHAEPFQVTNHPLYLIAGERRPRKTVHTPTD